MDLFQGHVPHEEVTLIYNPSIEGWMMKLLSTLMAQEPARRVLWMTSESELLDLASSRHLDSIIVFHHQAVPCARVVENLGFSNQHEEEHYTQLLRSLRVDRPNDDIAVTTLARSQAAPPRTQTLSDPVLNHQAPPTPACEPSQPHLQPVPQNPTPKTTDTRHSATSRPLIDSAGPVTSIEQTDSLQMGSLIVVIGSGGTGASTVALALSRSLSRTDATILIDAKSRPEIGFLLNLDPSTPGLSDLLYANSGEFDSQDLQSFLHHESAQLMVIPGVRSPRHKELMNGENSESLLSAASATARYVVVDGESDPSDLASGAFYGATGRSLMNRSILERASRILLVCDASPKGLFAFGTLLRDVVESQIALPLMDLVINRSPDNSKKRRAIDLEIAQISAIQGLKEDRWNLHVHVGFIAQRDNSPRRLDLELPEMLLTSLRKSGPLRSSRRESYASLSSKGSDELGLKDILDYFDALPPLGL